MRPGGPGREPYELLAAFYGGEWGSFSRGFLRFVDRVVEKLGATPASALDLACGTGELAIALAGRGWNVVGLDLSPAMIGIARGKGLPVEFREGDMRSFDLGARFDLVTCSFDSLNYLLDPREVLAAFTCVRSHLEPRGLFLFDVNTPQLYEKWHHGTIEREVEGTRFRQELRYEAEEKRAYTTFRFGPETEVHVQRAYEREEILPRLQRAGLRPLEVGADTKGAPADHGSERLFLVAVPDSGS